MKPWTWEEIAEMERTRGVRFNTFVRNYGLRGRLALELSRRGHSRRRCALWIDDNGCTQCKIPTVKACKPWTERGRKNLTAWYLREIEKHGRLPETR
jgi:hypothetical protein